MRERTVEQALRRAVARSGGLALKFVSPGWDGAPDRLILMPAGRLAFVETKAPGQKPRPLQLARHRQLRKLGFKVFVLDNPGAIQELLNEVTSDGI